MHDNITLPPQLSARVEQAVDNFMQGYGCCQSVVAAFADLYGLDDTMAKRIASRHATAWYSSYSSVRASRTVPSSVPSSWGSMATSVPTRPM